MTNVVRMFEEWWVPKKAFAPTFVHWIPMFTYHATPVGRSFIYILLQKLF